MRLILLPALMLAGCARPADPGVRVEYQTVTKEVQRPCPVTVPTRPAPLGALPTDTLQLAVKLAAKLAEYAAPGEYADRSEAALRTCTS